jgi:antirestriction protein ArdC
VAFDGGSERHLSSSTTRSAGRQAAGVTGTHREDHANFLKSWFVILQTGKRVIFTDVNLDQEQADFLKGWQPP